ncbi:unnamed protein product [Prorocentrum cordatum]|uniref:U2A'/phosphoprotein 32 family A C-terminal domain-containing protein n=1 Tax=Prorocentrum cordatum TaxID=2364126 RepID=A0ABN9UUX1_9DINO|nr:unnamed protein product [Polarella glacialis]
MAAGAMAAGRRRGEVDGGGIGRTLTEEMVFMRTKCNRLDLIKHLNLWGNDLQNISVIRHMPNLEVLSLSVNRVDTLNDLRGCPRLAELYLRKNNVQDLAEVQYLCNLRHLRVLWLSDNPCASLPHYRMYILQRLPSLGKLDSQEVTADERREAQCAHLADFPTRVDDSESPGEEGYPAVEASDESPGRADSSRAQPRAGAGGAPGSSPQHGERRPSAAREETPSAFGEASRASRHSACSFHLQESSPARHWVAATAASSRGSGEAPPGGAAAARGPPAREGADGASDEEAPSSEGEHWAASQGRGQYLDSGGELDRPDRVPERAHQAWPRADSPGMPVARRSSVDDRREGGQRRVQRAASGAREGTATGIGRGTDRGSAARGAATPSGSAGAPARADNVLCAVLALVKELDGQGLELVRRAVDQRLFEA